MPREKHENLKDALIAEAFAVIADKGVEQLSLREIARRLGVSHQAPYKHFPSRDHILAAVVARCYADLARHLAVRAPGATPAEDLHNMGLAYLDFAERSPLQYRLMFNTPLPPAVDHPEMLEQAHVAFSQLHQRLRTMALKPLPETIDDPDRHDAMFIWSALHGLASLLQADALDTLAMTQADRQIATRRLFQRMRLALHP